MHIQGKMKQYAMEKLFRLTLFSVAFLVLFTASNLLAETYYVVPKTEVPLRSGKGVSYRIVAIVPDGTEVEVIETEGAWSRVRLDSGKEGWMLSRYLSPELPPRIQLDALRKERDKMNADLLEAKKQLQDITHEKGSCRNSLESCLAKYQRLRTRYDVLERDSKDVITLKNKYQQAASDLQKAGQELRILKQENQNLKENQNVKWFLAGSGVLLLGWLIGLIIGRSGRRRRPSLL